MKLRYSAIIIPCFLCLAFFNVQGQNKYLDSSYFAPLIKMSYGFQIPDGDMGKRFGFNHNLGFHVNTKFKNYWTVGAKGSFMWGNQVKEDSLLTDIQTTDSEGFDYVNVIDQNGELGRIYFEQRGFTVMATAGRIFNVLAPTKNSGIMVHLGAGVMWHKIRLDYRESTIPTLDKEGRKGYDRLSLGPAGEAFIGYVYLSKSRLINFYGGLEFNYAYTRSLRKYNYDTRQPDTAKRNDFLYGIRVGWILPLYKGVAQEYYYY